MGQNPGLFSKVFPNRYKMSLRGPSEGSLSANVTAAKIFPTVTFVHSRWHMIPFLRPLESDSSSNFHAVDFVWMNPSLPQRSCSADRRSWSGDFFLHDWHSLYHWDTSCVISTESDKRFRDSHFPLIIKMNSPHVVLQTVRQVDVCSIGDVRKWGWK